MSRKRVNFYHDLSDLFHSSGGNLGKVSIDNIKDCLNADAITNAIPESAALPLGRPEGSFLSDKEKGLLMTVQQAFEDGVLNELSPMQRNCFTDVIISGDTYRDVADRYQITKGSVQHHIKKAAIRIRKAIGNLND